MLDQKVEFDTRKFLKDMKPSKKFTEITKQMIQEESKKLVDYNRLKRDETYSLLANQIFGAEIF